MANRVFNEIQTYRGTWIMYLILLFELPTLVLLLVFFFRADDKSEMGIALIVMVSTLLLIFLFILNLKLETRIDDSGVSFRYFPFIRNWRKIEKDRILSIQVINYSPITDYGGWGLKGNKTAKAYSILGNEGLLISTGEKKKIMIGTSKAKELRMFLENWKEE
ncbi:hypothetical protein AAGF08_15900 [Algoriphagus sp. SE2]|uniref:hypothetical protein n=1 Tax=Algoriphagus sp. SE2 TaxID=3141536 RepID=UPI0031CD2D41